MVNCAVLVCKRRSETSNLREHGISYHRFPKDRKLNELWTMLCGQKVSWTAKRTSVICSEHFTPECLKNLTNSKRKLVDGAIPTIQSCQCMENVESLKYIGVLSTSNVPSTDQHSKKGSAAEICNIIDYDELKPSTSLANSLRKRKLKAELQFKYKKIRRLQAKIKYLKRKVSTLRQLLEELD